MAVLKGIGSFQMSSEFFWNAGYSAANGFVAILQETGRWLQYTTGVKNLVARPLDLIPHWAMRVTTSLSPALIRVCADMSRLKCVIGAIEAVSKVDTDLLSAPRETRNYLIIKDKETDVGVVEYTIGERMVIKAGQIASWVMSVMECLMYCRNSTLLNLGAKGLTRVSWITTISGSVASVQGLYAEGQFLYGQCVAPAHNCLKIREGKVVVLKGQAGVISNAEIANSVIKIAIHASCLSLSILFSLPLLGYAFKTLYTAKLIALTAMTLSTIANHYWQRLIIGSYHNQIREIPAQI
jgi:hypothetical protein